MFTPVDLSSLVVFRIGFGLVLAFWAGDYLRMGRVKLLCIDPIFHFTYYGFDWIRPWPAPGMYFEFGVMVFCGLCMAAGLAYRVTSVVLAVCFTHFFLMDRTHYQNHYYLVLLISWLMTLLPVNRDWSLDVLNRWTAPSRTAPAWALGLVRFHIALPYVFGGIAKFDADWFAGEPLRHVLALNTWWPGIGPWLTTEFVVQVFIWGGLLFDLLVVPLLLWKPTRTLAYCVAVLFHITNSFLFNIHIFPWFMLIASTIFFEPDWPRRLIGIRRPVPPSPAPSNWCDLTRRTRLGVLLLLFYCGFHLLWPLRHLVEPGNTAWHERGHYFAWRMMLRGKTSGLRYFLTDPVTGQTTTPDLRGLLNEEQIGKFARDPEMVLHLAHFLAEECRHRTGQEVEVRALVLTSLNGRKPQLLIDPNVDLVREPRGYYRREWIVPLVEPLPDEPWNVPLVQWEQSVDLPSLDFLRPRSSGPE